MQESSLRSSIKTTSWRILATATTIMIVYLVTHKLPLALYIGAIEFFTKLFLFYCHEKIWKLIPFGLVNHWGNQLTTHY